MNNRIKELRKSLNLSQKNFGERIGLTRDNIANIEGDRAEIKDVIVKSVCREFNVSERWLRTGEGDMYLQPKDEIADIVAEIIGMDSPIRDSIIGIVESYLKLDDQSKKVIDGFVNELHSKIKEGH